MEVYGQVDGDADDTYVSEDDFGRVNQLELRAAYPESKRAAENLAVAYGDQYGVDYRIARMTHTYGPGMDINDTRVQTEFMRKGLAGEDIVLKTDGSLRRTYTYISDAISGMFYTMLADDGNRVYNIANENAKMSIKELAQTVVDASDSGSKLTIDLADTDPRLWSKTRNTYVDCSRLRGIGWRALVDPVEGIARTLEFHKGK
jgi:UDP-glucuronate decarboxylase